MLKRATDVAENMDEEDNIAHPISAQRPVEANSTDRVNRSFGPIDNNKVPVSPIYQDAKQPQSLFDNVQSPKDDQTHLFSGRSSGEKLRQLVSRMSDQS